MVTARQKALVQDSFAAVAARADELTATFYGRLFELDPTLRWMFKADLAPQRQKLAHMLTAVVKGLDRPEQLILVVGDLGRRHVMYGVRDVHYDSVGTALLWTLEQQLGEAFTPEMKEAWAAVYTLLARTMRDAARTEVFAVA
jgi:hemoglobin-like flavoprotein